MLILALLSAPAAAQTCAEDPPGAEWTFARLARLTECRGLRTVDELLDLLPADYFERFSLVYASQGLHGSTHETPRLVLYGKNRRLTVGVAGSPAMKNGDGFETVEYLPDGSYELGEIYFPPAGSKASARVTRGSPPACLECHPRPPAPVWASYPLWPGTYGSGVEGPAEREGFARFLKENAGRGRYRRLVGLASTRDLGRLRRANAELSEQFEAQAAERVLAAFAAHPRWPQARYALMAAYKGCGPLEEALPEAGRAGLGSFAVHRASAEATVQALAAQVAADAQRLAGAAGGYDAPPWLYLHRVEKLIRLDYLARPLLGLRLDDYAVSSKRSLLLSHHAAHELKLERLDFHLFEASCAELLERSREALADPLAALAATVNARGAALTAGDIAPLFDPSYLKDGFGPAEGAAECATFLRGTRVSVLPGALRVETASGTVVRSLADERHTLCALGRARAGRFVGNGLPARALAHASLARRQWGAPCGDCGAPAKSLRLLVSAPPGTLAGATARWTGGSVALASAPTRVAEVTLTPEPGRTLEVWTEHWSWEPGGRDRLPPDGADILFTLTAVDGSTAAVTRRLPPWPKAAAAVTAPRGHTLADARLGGELRVAWSVPPGFEPVEAEVVGLLRAGGALCEVDPVPPLTAPSARGALLRLPESCGGRPVRPAAARVGDPPAALTLQLTDAGGRTLEVFHAFW